MEGHPLDENIVNELRILQKSAPKNFLVELFGAFLKSMDSKLGLIRDAMTRGDAKMISNLAHGLKSSSAGIGALRLAGFLNDIEVRSRNFDLESLENQMSLLESEFSKVKAALQSIIDSSDSTPGAGKE